MNQKYQRYLDIRIFLHIWISSLHIYVEIKIAWVLEMARCMDILNRIDIRRKNRIDIHIHIIYI